MLSLAAPQNENCKTNLLDQLRSRAKFHIVEGAVLRNCRCGPVFPHSTKNSAPEWPRSQRSGAGSHAVKKPSVPLGTDVKFKE